MRVRAVLISAGFVCQGLFAAAPPTQWEITVQGEESFGRSVATDANGNVYVAGAFTGSHDFDPGAGTTTLTSWGGRDGFVAKYSSAGALQWARPFGSTNDDDYATSVHLGTDGYVYIAGTFRGTSLFSIFPLVATTSAGGMDCFYAKISSGGTFQWAQAFGGTGNDVGHGIASDGNGDLYVCGYFSGTADFNPASATNTMTSNGSTDGFVSKYTSGGSFRWARRFGGTAGDVALGVAARGTNAWVTGYFATNAYFGTYASGSTQNKSAAGGQDAFLVKENANGSLSWVDTFGGVSNEVAYEVAVDTAHNAYITGYFDAAGDYNPASGTVFTLTNGGAAFDTFVVRVNYAGALSWAVANQQSGSGTDGNGVSAGYGIAVDDDHVYVTGQYQGYVDFDPSSSTDTMAGPICGYCACGAVYLWALETDGTHAWVDDWGDEEGANAGEAVTVTSEGDIYTTGYFSDDVTCFGTSGDADIFLLKK